MFQPRSISQRIVHKITTQKKMLKKIKEEGRNPYHDLENAYVAQICLTWEALNWNYCNFKQRINNNSERSFCTAWIAQQFQQFQIFLHRFIENETCERGRRPELFARMRICYPKLLQVPELQCIHKICYHSFTKIPILKLFVCLCGFQKRFRS